MSKKMRVVQLGCGITGLVCAEELAKNRKVDELILSDIDTKTAEALAKRLKSDKITVQKADASDYDSLKRLMKDADIIISAVSWALNRKVMTAAMETKTHYVDFSMPLDYDEALKEENITKDAEITMLSCMGSDPGISNVFARYAADRLDSVEEIRTMDGDTGTVNGLDFYTLWSPVDMMDEVSTPAGIFKDGKLTYVPPLSSKGVYDFPEPVGPLTVYNTDHEETFMMSHLIEGVRNVDFRIAIDENFVTVAKTLYSIGMHKREPIDVKGVKVSPLDVLTTLMPKPTDLVGKVKGHMALVVETTGLLKGKKTMIKTWTVMSHEKAYELCRVNATGYLVGVAGAIGTEMLIDGEVKQHGLVWPEMLPADRYVERMREKQLTIREEIVEVE